MLRVVKASRYVMPFREGGSVPALVEADDLGLYVVKLRGAGQGARALVAELLVGELARAAGLLVPELVVVDVDRALSESEPDPELAAPLEASAGLNLGLDYLPGSITFDPVVGPPPDPQTASRTVLFDALMLNVDRTPRNPNLLSWHARVWLIDHGAALYVHHGWQEKDRLEGAADPFTEVRQHVLLRWATELEDAGEHLRRTLDAKAFAQAVAAIPDAWLEDDRSFPEGGGVGPPRAAYRAWLEARLAALPLVVEEALRGRALSV